MTKGIENKIFLLIAVTTIGFLGLSMNESYAVVPQFETYVADDPNNLDNVFSDGDILTITFDIATNATGGGTISQAEINANFTDGAAAPDWGTTYSGVWSADSTILTVTVTDATGGALTIGTSTIAGAAATTIADADGGNADLINVGGDSATLSGDFGVLAVHSCDRDCTPPTMGPNANGHLVVSKGFSYNGNAVDVSQWHTEYPLIVVETGKVNVLQAKIYDEWGTDDIRAIRVSFGVPAVGQLYEGEAIVEFYPNDILGPQINVVDKLHLLDNVKITTEPTSCNGESSETCLMFTMEHVFKQAPLSSIVGMTVSDRTRNGAQFYFNDGVEVQGESLNPPVIEIVPLHTKSGEQILLTQIDRANEVWIDEKNNLWTKNAYDTWFKLTSPKSLKVDVDPISSHGLEREHAYFETYKVGQEMLAKQVWNSIEIQSELPDSTTIEFQGIHRMDDPELQKAIIEQIKKAQEVYEHKFDSPY